MKKNIFILTLTILAFGCEYTTTPEKTDPIEPESIEDTTTQDFSWLLGSWIRTNNEAGKTTFENWTKDGDQYLGYGYTLENQDTTFYEQMHLVEKAKKWHLIVNTKGDTTSTSFELNSIEKDRFIAANPLNEFPKKIVYFMDGDTLKAEVSNLEMMIPFAFVKNN